MYDVIIIGAGVSGCAVARELSAYEVNACVIEKCGDVCCGTSKANSAIVHAGYDAAQGSLMAKLNVIGNESMESLSEELDFPFERCGSIVVCLHEEDIEPQASLAKLQELYERGKANGVKGLRLLSAKEAFELEPNLSTETVAALYAPTGGIVCPFDLTMALAENAAENGVEFKLNTKVQEIKKTDHGYLLVTNQGDFETACVVNAAGVYADELHNMVSSRKLHITPRKGEYCLLDKTAGRHVSRTVFQVPGKYGKGVLITPTVHGNLLIGPTANDIEDKEGTDTTRSGLEELLEKAGRSVRNLPLRQIITSFAGLRAHEDGHDFVIEEVFDAKDFFDVAGIESPGLTAAPAIGVMIAGMLKERLQLKKKEVCSRTRKRIFNPSVLCKEERAEFIKQHPAYGNIICRCEMVTEGEILDAIHRPLGAKSLDAVKRRTRAGMGRCQSGFCSPKVLEILARELSADWTEITKAGQDSVLVVEER